MGSLASAPIVRRDPKPDSARPTPTVNKLDETQARSVGVPRYLSVVRPVSSEASAPEAIKNTENTIPTADANAGGAASHSASTEASPNDAALTGTAATTQSVAPAPLAAVDTEVIDAELSEVTADPTIVADRHPGSPTLLKPPPGQDTIAEAAPVPPAPPVTPARAADASASTKGIATQSAAEEVDINQQLANQAKEIDSAGRQAAPGGLAQGDGGDDGGTEAKGDAGIETSAGGGAVGAAGGDAGGRVGGSGSGSGSSEGSAAIAGAVPPPQPDALQAQMPGRSLSQDEFVGMFEAGNTPEQDQALLAGMMMALRGEVEQEKASILADAEAQKQQILVAAEAQAETMRATAAATIERVMGSYAAAREALTATTASNKAALTEQIAQQVAQIETESAAKAADADAQLTARQTQINDSAATQSAQPQQFANQEAVRAEAALEAAARECDTAGAAEATNYPGSDDHNPEKRAAAQDVSDRSAADIREKKAPLAEDIRSRSADSSAKYFEYANSVSAQIEQARADFIPSLAQFATEATASVQQCEAGVSASLDQRLAVDLAALDAAEQSCIAQVEQAQTAALAQIDTQSNQACSDIDSQTATLLENIDASMQETETVVFGSSAAYVPGMRDIIEATQTAISSATSQGRASLADSAMSVADGLASFAGEFSSQMNSLASGAAKVADAIQQGGESAGESMLQGQAQQAAQTALSVATEQESLTRQVLVEIDAAVTTAEADMAAINDRFQTELTAGVNESIQKAILPRTDQIETRAHEAAEQVDDSWYKGLGRALLQIVIGLVIMVVVALVVAAIAAAFGVILTAWTAVMIAGAILLVVGFVLAIYSRARQPELANAPWYQVAGIALLDTVGYTGIHESISGRDFVTNQTLTAGQRTERGVMGAVTMISLVLGARSAIKGPPGGAFTRPNTLPRGFVGWAEALPQAWRGSRILAIEMWQGTRQGASSVSEWVRTRLLGREPTRPSPEALANVGEPSNTTTGSHVEPTPDNLNPPPPRPEELPYRNPPEIAVARRGQPIDVSAMDPNRTYLWAVDAEGNFIIAPEDQPGFGRMVKHGDLVPGAGGEFRGAARAGGEMRARVNPDTGEVTWVMDSDSSYSFARTDQQVLGEPSRAAAHDLLTDTGTDTSNIDVKMGDRWLLTPPQAPRPGAAPIVPPAQIPPDRRDASASP